MKIEGPSGNLGTIVVVRGYETNNDFARKIDKAIGSVGMKHKVNGVEYLIMDFNMLESASKRFLNVNHFEVVEVTDGNRVDFERSGARGFEIDMSATVYCDMNTPRSWSYDLHHSG